MRERSRLPLLLTELVIMLLVAAACAAVCLSIFASARRAARESGELGNAANLAQSAAELYVSARGDLAQTARLLGTQGELRQSYDENWQPADSGPYTLEIRESAHGEAQISVSGDEGDIFTLHVRAVTYG